MITFYPGDYKITRFSIDFNLSRKYKIMDKEYAVTKLSYIFDSLSIIHTLPKIEIDSVTFAKHDQLSLTHSTHDTSWYGSIGKLSKVRNQSTGDFSVVNNYFKNTYMSEVINIVKKQAEDDQVNIGRIRLMRLKAKTCYTYHKDKDEFRYHIPLMTNEKCFFMNGTTVEQMLIIGQLYKFNTNAYHTAINASFLPRLHIVFDTF